MLHRLCVRDRNGFFAALVGVFLTLFAHYGEASTNGYLATSAANHIISDAHTGLALFGYDPVAYHADGKASEGSPNFIATHQNLVWRFVSMANREAFLADLAAYIPAFGGHDARSVSEGRMVIGDPSYFLISRGTLTLFRSEESRDYFAAKAEVHDKARARWPDVVRQFASH